MSIFTSLDSIQEELSKCMKCGNCQEVCPIYKENYREVSVARGKISLIQMVMSGEIDLTEGIADRLSLCTTCMACSKICPCGVRFDKIILAARQKLCANKACILLRRLLSRPLKLTASLTLV